jgi:2'-5' RNA ligase
MMRLFIAFPLTSEIEESLGRIILDLKQKRGRVKWVAHSNIHLTAKFLGETDESLVDRIKEAVAAVAARHHPAACTIDEIGGFPNLNRPRVIWAGLKGDIESLAEISGEIDEAMHRLGFERENRKFKPHLTLGRVRDLSGIKELCDYIGQYRIEPAGINLDRLVLFKSTLTPQGPIYERLFEIRLGG